MNFKRIMLIFLVIFVIIDGFLFFAYNRNAVGDSANNGNNVLDEMRKDQISFKRPSNAKHSGYYFAATNNNDLREQVSKLQDQTYRFNEAELISRFKTPVKVEGDDFKKALDQVVADDRLILFGEEYGYSKQLSNEQQVVYVQRVAQGPIYSKDAQIRFELDDDKQVIGYSQTYLSDVELLREKTETISEERALTWLYQYNEVPNGSKVMWSNLAYTKLTSARGRDVFLPTWVFALKPSNADTLVMKRVNAYTGEILKTGSNASPSSNANGEILSLT